MFLTTLLFFATISSSLIAMDNEERDYTGIVKQIIALESMEQTPRVKNVRDAFIQRLPILPDNAFELECFGKRFETTLKVITQQHTLLKNLQEALGQGTEGKKFLPQLTYFLDAYTTARQLCSYVLHQKEEATKMSAHVPLNDLFEVYHGVNHKLIVIDVEVVQFLETVSMFFVDNLADSAKIKKSLKELRAIKGLEVPTSGLFNKYIHLFSKKNIFHRSAQHLQKTKECLDFYIPAQTLITLDFVKEACTYNEQVARIIQLNEAADQKQLKSLKGLVKQLQNSKFQAPKMIQWAEKEKAALAGLARIVATSHSSSPEFEEQIVTTLESLSSYIEREKSKPLPIALDTKNSLEQFNQPFFCKTITPCKPQAMSEVAANYKKMSLIKLKATKLGHIVDDTLIHSELLLLLSQGVKKSREYLLSTNAKTVLTTAAYLPFLQGKKANAVYLDPTSDTKLLFDAQGNYYFISKEDTKDAYLIDDIVAVTQESRLTPASTQQHTAEPKIEPEMGNGTDGKKE